MISLQLLKRSKQALEDTPRKSISMENIAETELPDITATLDFRIQDFRTANEEVFRCDIKGYQDFGIFFTAKVFPNDVDKDWLSVSVRARNIIRGSNEESIDLVYAVSIIDIEGRERFTRYFDQVYTSHCDDKSSEKNRYMEKSFILSRADEFLSDGALFLRCDIRIDFGAIKHLVCTYYEEKHRFLDLLHSMNHACCHKYVDETGNSSDTYRIFDLTEQVLGLPQFHELRKRFGVYGRSPDFVSFCSVSKEDNTDILENVWIFDTRSDRFLLSIASGQLGHQLLNASPVIKLCMNTPMKEQNEKHDKISNLDTLTFQIVLTFLEIGKIYSNSFSEIVEVYKFSHLYEMENLQQICAELIVRDSQTETELEESQKIAELFSDDYLFKLLQSRKREILEPADPFIKDVIPNFDCFV